MTTLENSYCVPNSRELAQIMEVGKARGIRTYYKSVSVYWSATHSMPMRADVSWSEKLFNKIPVQHFIDLVEDKPSTWRIKEYQASKGVRDGFWHIFYISQSHMISIDVDGSFNLNGRKVYLKTFTDLLTLIKFLTPPTK